MDPEVRIISRQYHLSQQQETFNAMARTNSALRITQPAHGQAGLNREKLLEDRFTR